jgi:hypothetical protein
MAGISSDYDPRLDPYYMAIGHIGVAWADFEFALNDAIWELANVDRAAGTCMTAQLIGPAPRFRCLIALLKARRTPQALLDLFNTMSRDAGSLAAKRNRYLHDPIALQPETGVVYRIEATAEKSLRLGGIPVDLAKLSELIGDIDKIIAEFDNLMRRVLAETPAWPREQYSRSEGIQRHRTVPKTSPTPPPKP